MSGSLIRKQYEILIPPTFAELRYLSVCTINWNYSAKYCWPINLISEYFDNFRHYWKCFIELNWIKMYCNSSFKRKA
ncbi:hypothetical protein CY34DRAFT_771322 [Suillus luteus UH-Slu-Lm8-n1]|uniref:Uncharacterized protein n=1 Tax=Suillus luteus UH-Slu-Lm8-n1 TaxID=930992 RepID=A0A0D0BUT7_9AGAM|nr:hypothetical protein CY34DRAFT_771322 [Suillus luteus UH-Slu-Lm8-n1]